jgi:opacity protein-like surface antigen
MRMAFKQQALKTQLLASVAVISVTLTVSASAANVAIPAPPAAIWSWTGFYFGGHAGYGWGRDPFVDATFGGKAPLNGVKSSGFVGGFQAGANWQLGALVGGAEIDLSGTGIKGSTSASSISSFANLAVGISQTQADKFDTLASARGRLGYAVWPNVLLYGTGGLAWSRFEKTQAASISIPPLSIVTTNVTPSSRFGWVAGAGAEARIGQTNWLARVEYLHYDFGDSGSQLPADSGRTSGHLTTDVVRAGLSYKFGQDRLVAAGAADWMMPTRAPRAAVVAWNWSGFYVGGHAGYGWGSDPFTNPDTLVLASLNSSGFVGGFQAGANWQGGAWVGGLEVDLSGTDIRGSTPTTSTARMSDHFDMLGSARARLGYVIWPNVLVYGTGGLAWTRLEQGTSDIGFASTAPSWQFGWVAGVGAETRIGQTNWLARLEYLHYDFGESDSSFSPGFSTTSGHPTNDVVRAGLSYKFGREMLTGDAPPPATVSPRNWNGFYLGGHAGYGWGSDPRSDSVFGSKAPDFGRRTGMDSRGFVGGFQAGSNWQMSSWVGGLEIDLSTTGIKGSTTKVGTGETFSDAFDLLGSSRARLGYVPWPNLLLYGTGGLAWTRFEQSTRLTDSGSTTPSWRFGWVAGLGGETRLMNTNWFVRLEYLHYDFGNSGSSAVSLSGFGGPFDFSTSEKTGHLTTDVFRTGLSLKFD